MSRAELDLTVARQKITGFIKRKVGESRVDGVVLGISGGIDSAVTAYLCVEALGSRRVLGVIMPDGRVTPEEDVEDSKMIAQELCIETKFTDIATIHRSFMKSLEPNRLAEGNLRARIRMSILYYYANQTNRIVVGTGDKSEALVGYFCYDEKTRAVTNEGLKGYAELEKGDTVFSYDFGSGKVIESKVDDVFVFDYNGKMINFESRNANLLVTPNHRMLVNSLSSGDNRYVKPVFRTAEECLQRKYTVIPRPEVWDGEQDLPTSIPITFSQRHIRRTILVDVEDLFFLFGLFIGDGCVVEGRVMVPVKSNLVRAEYQASFRDTRGRYLAVLPEMSNLTMKEYKTYETDFALPDYRKCEARTQLVKLLEKYGIGYSSTRDLIRVPSKELYEIFHQCGVGALNKRIPRWMLKYHSRYLASLEKGLRASDGSHSGHAFVYYTNSPGLKDDFTELCIKLGRMPTVNARPSRKAELKGGKVIKSSMSYVISYGSATKRTRVIRNSRARRVDYSGIVWCPSVPPHENLLVERNGRYIFCGNTKYGDGGVDILPIADLYKTEVRKMGEILGISRRIISKRSSPRLWPGQTAEGELGISYEVIDDIFRMYQDQKLGTNTVARKLRLSAEEVKKVVQKFKESSHKRTMPEICRLRR